MNVLMFALGALFGAFLVYVFNPKDITVNGRNRAKNGGIIDFGADFGKPERKGIFSKLKLRRNKK